MSPSHFWVSSNAADVLVSSSDGSTVYIAVSNIIGIRPVVNLKANVEISGGVGTKNNPYQISTT